MAPGLKYVIGNGSQGQLYSPPDPQVPLLCACLHQRYSRLYRKEGQISQAILGPLVTGSGAKAKKWIHSYRLASLPFLLSGLLHCAAETVSWHCSWGRNQNFDVPSPYTPLSSDKGLWTLQRWESSGKEWMVKKGKESLAGSGRCRPKAKVFKPKFTLHLLQYLMDSKNHHGFNDSFWREDTGWEKKYS